MRAQGLDPDEAPQPAREDDLRNGSIVDELDGVPRPTLYGLMVFGRDPQAYAHTLSLFVQCTAYGGTDQAGEVVSAGEGKGRLQTSGPPRHNLRTRTWVAARNHRRITAPRTRTFNHGAALGAACNGVVSQCWPEGDVRGHPAHRSPASAPEAALREALVNAVIHRDYAITGSQVLLEVFDDRIVVTSPGALPNHHDRRSGAQGRRSAVAQRDDGERHGRRWADGTPRTGLADDAARPCGASTEPSRSLSATSATGSFG